MLSRNPSSGVVRRLSGCRAGAFVAYSLFVDSTRSFHGLFSLGDYWQPSILVSRWYSNTGFSHSPSNIGWLIPGRTLSLGL